MKPTEQDLTYFKGLSQTEMGKWLVDYCKRMADHIHDSRSWGKDDSKESAAHAARLLDEHLIKRIRPHQPGEVRGETYE